MRSPFSIKGHRRSRDSEGLQIEGSTRHLYRQTKTAFLAQVFSVVKVPLAGARRTQAFLEIEKMHATIGRCHESRLQATIGG